MLPRSENIGLMKAILGKVEGKEVFVSEETIARISKAVDSLNPVI